MAEGRVKFILDTQLNKTGINELKHELQALKNLTSQQMLDFGLSKTTEQAKKDLAEIKASASQVEAALNKSFSASLGTTNLTKFNQELKSMNLSQIQQNLSKAGALGQMAFRNMTTEILTTKLQLKETNTLFSKMGETLTNTIRWGIASSAMNNFTGAVQKAWNYTKNLDKSLNDIRIVSNASADQMERFAIQANKAAKALGASTKAYADASLIYYQQGLSEADAAARADITIKMANTTGESAQQVSDYMTAIWNNFDNGSKSLEYYADVMTALGAATASSTEEIAGGLEKFAAVADTVGLSYEYATAALATITAETRQSEEVVGTALKTIFARIQGLNLGETLDDGTTLNKYSEALSKVGISIKDSTGQLKSMDSILSEMGDKWITLSNDQQVALAQTVAGVRQYNQLIGLMDNWDVFKKNLEIASNATGTLNKQQAIYMDSIEAHLDKVGASAERVFNALTDPEGINALLDSVDFLITGVANYIEAIGGSRGVLLQLGSIGSKVFGKQIAQGLSTTIMNLKKAKINAEQLNAEFEVFKQFKGLSNDDPQFELLVKMKEKVIALNNTLNEQQREEANALITKQNELENEIVLWQQKTDEAEKYFQTITGTKLNTETNMSSVNRQKETLKTSSESFINEYKEIKNKTDFSGEGLILLDTEPTKRFLSKAAELIDKATELNLDSVDELKEAHKKFNKIFEYSQEFVDDDGNVHMDTIGEETFEKLLKEYKTVTDQMKDKTKETLNTIDDMVNKTGDNIRNQAQENLDTFNESIEKWTWQDTIDETTVLTSKIFDVANAVNSVFTIPDIWGNENLTGGEKILQTIMAIATAINGFSQITSIGESFKKIVGGLYNTLVIGQGALALASGAGEEAEKNLATAVDETQKEITEKAIQAKQESRIYKKAALENRVEEQKLHKAIKKTINLIHLKKAEGEISEEEEDYITKVLSAFADDRDEAKPKEDLTKEKLFDFFVEEWGFEGLDPDDLPIFNNKKSLKQDWGLTNSEADIASSFYKRAFGKTVNDQKFNVTAKEKEKMPKIVEKLNAVHSGKNIKKVNLDDQPQKVVDTEDLAPGGEKAISVFTHLKGVIAKVAATIKGFIAANAAWLAPLAIAVAAIGIAMYTVYQKTHEARQEYESAAQDLEILKQRTQEAQAAQDDFNNSLSAYTDTIIKIKELDKGTQEYVETLKSANEQAQELIEKYGLFGQFKYDENGMIIIDPEALREIQTRVDENVYNARISEQAQAGYVARAEFDANMEEFAYDRMKYYIEADESGYYKQNSKEQEYFNYFTQQNPDTGQYEVTGSQIKTGKADEMLQEIVTAYNGIENAGALGETDLFNRLAEETGFTTTTLENFAYSIEGIDGDFKELQSTLSDLNSQYISSEEKASYYDRQTYAVEGEKLLKGKVSEENADIANTAYGVLREKQIEKVGQKDYSEIREAQSKNAQEWFVDGATYGNKTLASQIKMQGWKDLLTGGKDAKRYADVENDEELARLYAQVVHGKTAEEVAKYKYEGDMGKGQLIDKEGNKLFDDNETSDEEMRKAIFVELATQKYIQGQQAGTNTEYIKTLLADVETDAAEMNEKYGTDFANAIYTSIANEEPIDYSNIFPDITPSEYKELMGMDNTELASALISPELAAEMGKNLEEIGQEIKDSFEGWEWSEQDAISRVIGDNLHIAEEDVEKVSNMAEVLMQVSDSTNDVGDQFANALNEDAEAAIEVADDINKINKAIGMAEENLDDWMKAIKKGPKDLEAYSKAIDGMRSALSTMFDIEDADFEKIFDADFIDEQSELIQKSLEGDTEAFDQLQDKMMEEYILDFKLPEGAEYDSFFDDVSSKVAMTNQTLLNEFQSLQDVLDSQNLKVGQGAEISEDMLNSMNAMIAAAGMTTEQVNSMFSMMGYNVEYSEEPTDQKRYIDQVTRYTREVNADALPDGYTSGTEEIVITKPVEVTDTVLLSAMTTSTPTKDGPAPKISKLTKAPERGSGKTYTPKGPSGGSKKKKKDPQKDELDRYQKVNSKLDKIGNTLDKLQDKRDKLTGQDLFDNFLKQFDTLNDKIDVTKDKLAIAIDEMNEYKQELAKDYGIKFREDGIIDNYKEQYYKELNALNAAIDKYSASDKDSDQEKLEKAQERYDKYNELIKKYDELIGSFIPELEKDIRDSINQQIEIKLDVFNYEIGVRLKMKDAELQWNEFKKVVLDDIDELDIFGNTKARLQDFHAYFKEMDDGLVQVATKHVNDILTELQKMDATGEGDIYKDSRQNLMDQLNEYYSTLIDNLTEVHELSEEIHDSYMEMMDETQSKFDEQIDAYSAINDLIEHDKNVITMIYGEESYSALSQFYNRQEENNNKQLDFQKQQVEFWANQMTLTEEGSEEWDKAKENWMSAVSEWNSAVEAAIQNLQDKYLNAINEIFQKLNNEVTNGLGLDYVETQWDLVNRNAEEYLDSVNAIYNVQQLQSKYLDAIEQNDSSIQQKKLNDLMEQEIGYLREQDKLSQYDIDRANLKYEIALKQIALEEAQQNKTQLRLRRDSQGNYSYQYTADDDQVSSIQQEIADLYNQLYNLDAEEYRGNLEGLYDVWVEFQERMAEAAQINDPEQRAAKELLIKEQYGELINTLAEKNELIQSNLNQSAMSHLFDLYNQNIENYDMMTAEQQAILSQFMTEETDFTNAAFDNLFGLYNTTVENFQGMSNAQRDILMGSIVPQWETAVQAMADKIIGEGGFFPVCSEAFTKLDEATQEYETGLTTLQEAAGQSAEAIKNGLDPVIEKTQQLVKDNDELIETYNKELEAIRGVINELEILKAKYGEAFDAANKAAEAAKNMWMAASNKDANADPSKVLNSEFGTETDITPDLNEKGGYDQPTVEPASEPAKPTLEIGSFVDVKSGALWYSNSYGGGKSGRAKDGKIKYINSKGSHPYNIGGAGWIKKSDIVGYDTGGYTGDWGSDGRLAMLHQKELVLNASDTKNMLNAIEIVRDITNNLGATLMSRMAGISAASAYGGDSGILEQNVHITAEFPNVENSHEIEDALNNLINKASQYIQK